MKLSNTLQIFVLLFVVFAVGCSPKLQTTQSKFNIVQNIPENIERWEKDIVAFEDANNQVIFYDITRKAIVAETLRLKTHSAMY